MQSLPAVGRSPAVSCPCFCCRRGGGTQTHNLPSILFVPYQQPIHQTMLRARSSPLSAFKMTSRSISTVPFLVSPAELKSLQASAEPPIVLDGSWHLPSPTPRHGFTEFKTKRIPGAAFWDVDIIATKDERNLSHMMPSSELFADACCEGFDSVEAEQQLLMD